MRSIESKIIPDSFVSCSLVSLVIPVYNVEKYVDDCLRSIEEQTYQNIEIIIVDDGSTDGSSEICRKHARIDSRIVYLRKSNGGLSSARNYGIQKATGQWVAYIDSDDMVDPRYVENLLRTAQISGSALAVCGFSIVGENAHVFHTQEMMPQRYEQYTAKIALSILYSERYSCCAAWGKLAKIDSWKKVTFPEGRKFEDFSRIDCLVEPNDSVAFLQWNGYAYRKSGTSITAQGSMSSASDLAESISELEKKVSKSRVLNNRSVSFKLCLESTRLIRILSNIAAARQDASIPNSNLFQFAREIIKQHWLSAITNSEASLSQRMRIAVFRWFPQIGIRILNSVTSGRAEA